MGHVAAATDGRPRFGRLGPGMVLAAAALFASACTETELAIHAAKQLRKTQASGKPSSYYKVGSPYRVNGTYYHPAVDYGYRETGIASWYGPKFHGRSTANGEIFDMNALSAAHRTLPLPSVVRVINLQNGRSLVLRVNDRGPFVGNRIIDLSRRAAQLLGIRNRGTAPVRVEIMAEESRRTAALAQRGLISDPTLVAAAGPDGVAEDSRVRGTNGTVEKIRPAVARGGPPKPSPAILPDAGRPTKPAGGVKPNVSPSDLYVQAGSFSERINAARAQARLGKMAPAHVVEARVEGRRFFRVWLGPIGGTDMADHLLARVSASGYPEARIVLD